jgi:hypothetical protein
MGGWGEEAQGQLHMVSSVTAGWQQRYTAYEAANGGGWKPRRDTACNERRQLKDGRQGIIEYKVLLYFDAGSLHHAVMACALAEHTMRRRTRHEHASAYMSYALSAASALGKYPKAEASDGHQDQVGW